MHLENVDNKETLPYWNNRVIFCIWSIFSVCLVFHANPNAPVYDWGIQALS